MFEGKAQPAEGPGRASKAELRAEMVRRLKALSPLDRAERTRRATEALVAFLATRVPAGEPIALYAPTPTELSCEAVAHALAPKHPLCFPRVEGDRLAFRAGDLRTLLADQSLVREPAADAPALAPRAIVIPARAFDHAGVRLGRGAGYFDRTLRALDPAVLLVGFVFRFQLVDRLPREPHDESVDWVVTDEEPPWRCEAGAA